MKNIQRAVFACFLMMLLVSSAALAQFEGQISMNMYSQEKNGNTEVSELNLYATPTRVLIKGEEDFDLMDNMSTDGLLIRNDKKDFIIMTGSNEALQVTKAEIEGLVEMMSSWSGESASQKTDDIKTNYSFSDRTQTIRGFETAEMIVKDENNPDKYLSVWLAPKVDINWGMLAERWKNMPESIDADINGMSQDLIFRGKNFPMLIEAVEGDKRTKVMEVTNINKSSVAKAMVELPSGVTLMSFKDYVFKKMMEG